MRACSCAECSECHSSQQFALQSGLGLDQTEEQWASLPDRDDNSHLHILFIIFLFAATVRSLIVGYTHCRKVYHMCVYDLMLGAVTISDLSVPTC